MKIPKNLVILFPYALNVGKKTLKPVIWQILLYLGHVFLPKTTK